MAKILYGGGFDPIHNGHLNMAMCASKQFDADVIFIPAPIAIWKHSSINAQDKVAMMELAIKDYDRFSVDLFEINSGKTTNYSIDTVRHFLSINPNEKFYYLIGTDQVNEFHRWKNAFELSRLAQIIYFERPNYKISQENITKFNMIKVYGEWSKAASSDIRQIKSMDLPFDVIKYIEKHNLYFMSKIRSFLSEGRFKHSLSVAHLAYEIAKSNKLDVQKAYIASIFHDIGKDISCSEQIAIMEEYFPEYLHMGKFSYHQFVGSVIAQKEFEIVDEQIINAIRFHATGNGEMDWLSMIVYASDKIEPTRGFDSSDLIDAMMKDYRTGFAKVLQANKEYLEKNKHDINNELTCKCFSSYLK